MTAEEPDPLLYTPDGPSPLSDTDSTATEHRTAPISATSTAIADKRAGTGLRQSNAQPESVGLRRGVKPARQGVQIAAVTFPEGWGVNRVRPYRAGRLRSKNWMQLLRKLLHGEAVCTARQILNHP